MEKLKSLLVYYWCLCTNKDISVHLLTQRCDRKLEEISQSQGDSPLRQLSPDQVTPEDFSLPLVLWTTLKFWISHYFLFLDDSGHKYK